jgi:uncharacterized protein (TIGR03435 family)
VRYAVLGTLIAIGCGVQLIAQTPSKDGPRFEVASIKPNPGPGGGITPTPTSFFARGHTLVQLIDFAYQLPNYRVVGGADWTRRERFDVNARIVGPRTPGDLRIMVRHLLEDRFALRVHREKRPLDVYVFMMARTDGKLGPKMTRVTRTCSTQGQTFEDRCSESDGVGLYRSAGRRWEDGVFVRWVELIAGRPVVDRTALSGQFDITLEYNPDYRRIPDGVDTKVTVGELEARPLVFTAICEQLGLKLDPGKESVDVLVIDNVERPTSD